MTRSKDSGKPASKAALQNQPIVYLSEDDHRNNSKFRKRYPYVIFVDSSDPRILNANEMDSVTRSDPSVFSRVFPNSENPQTHFSPGADGGLEDGDIDGVDQPSVPDGEPGIKGTDAGQEGYDADGVGKGAEGSLPDASSQSSGLLDGIDGRGEGQVMPPYDLAIDEGTYVVENESLDGIPTYSVTLTFESDGQGFDYVPLLVKQS